MVDGKLDVYGADSSRYQLAQINDIVWPYWRPENREYVGLDERIIKE